MSTSLIVILAVGHVPAPNSWRTAVTEARVPIQFPSGLDLAKDTGFVPARVDGREGGFYLFKEDLVELAGAFPALAQINLRSSVAYSLEFGRPLECAAASYTAAAMVARFNAIAFDPQSGSLVSERQLIEFGRVCQLDGTK